MRKLCKICGINPVTKKQKDKYRNICYSCYKKPYTRNKKNFCEFCGFIPLHRCQLDVHHIDGNKLNNKESNLMTLCANCHRLKTYLNKNFIKK